MNEQQRLRHNANSSEPTSDMSRHISMRLPTELYQRLEALAVDCNESVSQAARRLLSEGLEIPDEQAIDRAIATLLLVRNQLSRRGDAPVATTPAAAPASAKAVRTIDLFNAKTDLQHLVDEVARGDEIVITYAGSRRARLVGMPRTDTTGTDIGRHR